MLINYCRFFMLAYFIIAHTMSLAAHISKTVKISFEFDDVEETFDLPEDIIRMFKTIANMLKDSVGYKRRFEESIRLRICSAEFHQMINILSAAKPIQIVNEMRTRKMIFTTFDLDKVNILELENGVKEVILLMNIPSDELLNIIESANFLDVPVIVQAGAKVWVQQYFTTKSRFNFLNNDIKALIIKELTSLDFLAMMNANENEPMSPEQIAAQEESFRIALINHYNIKNPPTDLTAKAHYEELNDIGKFVAIPGGDYYIGSPESEANRFPDEKLHRITLSPFFIMDAPVTQEKYARMTGSNPSWFKEAEYCPEDFKEIEVNGVKIPVCSKHPVENVSHNDATQFANLMTEKDPKHKYRLPTEAQLEVVFRGGTTTAYVTGRDDEKGLGDYVWFSVHANNQTHPVRSKRANAFGIYRSIEEWAADYYDKDYNGSTGLDPEGPAKPRSRFVVRGSSFWSGIRSCRSAYRNSYKQDRPRKNVGFRLVRQ